MPQWLFGMSTYAFASEEQVVCSHIARGISQLATLNTVTRSLQEVASPFTDVQYVRAAPGQAVFRGGSPIDATSIVRFDLSTRSFETLRLSNNLQVGAAYVSVPRAIEFPTEEGLTAHGFFYAPQNSAYRAPEDERPPLIVKSHGGPTSAS